MGSDLTRLIEAINRVGIQNVSLLSRMTGMPKETIRYILKKRFPELGLKVGMLVDYEKIGLDRYFVTLKFDQETFGRASELLERLAAVSFLTYRSRAAMELRHVAMFAVPVAVRREFHDFLERLVQESVLESVEVERLEWTRHLELKSGYYDFGARTWSIDWDAVDSRTESPPAPVTVVEPGSSPDVDAVDMLVIKELEMDSWRTSVDIARKVGVNDRTLRWHYASHVAPLISSYYVRWLPVAPDELAKVMGLVYQFSGLDEDQLSQVRNLFNKFPFAWYEGGKKEGGYYQVHCAIPVEHMIGSLQFVTRNLVKTIPDWKTLTLDLTTSYTYTLPYESFTDKGGWVFDREKAIGSVLSMVSEEKNTAAGPSAARRDRFRRQRAQGARREQRERTA